MDGADCVKGTDGTDGGGEKNQSFMLISDLHSSNVIGCDDEISQSEQDADGADSMEGADGMEGSDGMDGGEKQIRLLC